MSTKNSKAPSVASNESAGQSLVREIMRQKHSAAIRFSGRDGYFIDEKRIGDLESSLISLLKSGETSVSPETLLKMNHELEELRRKDAESQLKLQSLNGEVAKKNGDIAELKKSITAKEALLSRSEADYKATTIALTASVNNAKHDLEEFKRSAKAGFLSKSEEEKADYEQKLAELRSVVSSAHKNLDIEKNLRKNEEVAIQRLKDTVASLEAEKKRADAHAKRMKESSYAQVVKAGPNEQSILLNEEALLKQLGPKSLAFLREGDVVMSRINDKAYNLMLATKNATSNKVRGLYPLIEAVFKWLKERTKAMGRRVASFVDLVYQDIINLRLKTLEHYKNVLDELRLDIALDMSKYTAKNRKEMPKAEKTFKFSKGFITKFLFGTRKNMTWLGKVRLATVSTTYKVARALKRSLYSAVGSVKAVFVGGSKEKPSEKALGKQVVDASDHVVEEVFDVDEYILKNGLSHIDPMPMASGSS
jgi:hypothetical protein